MRRAAWSAAAMTAGSAAALAGPPEEGSANESPPPGWLGRLEASGLWLGASSTAEYTSVLGGGLRRGGSFRGLLTIDATLDLDALAGVGGGTAFARYLSVSPESGGSMDVGDIQVTSNIESDRHLDTIYELWYEQLLFGGRVRLKVGKVDANTEFGFMEVAGGFANSSAGFSPTILGFPSYPDPATGVNLFATVVERDGGGLTLGYGLYDGAGGVDGVPTGSRGPSSFFRDALSDDWFHIAQGEWVWAGEPGRRWFGGGRVSAGAWWHTGDFHRFDGGTEDGTGGLLLTWEQRLCSFHRDGGGGEARGVSVFAQFGWADEAVSEVGRHWGCGAVWHGPMPSRAGDSAGLYITLAGLSDDPAAGYARDELACDLYYHLRLTPWLFVQPEFQVVFNPGGDPGVETAWIAGVRVGAEF